MRKRLIDLRGKTFGALRVIGKTTRANTTEAMWECLCLCGKTRIVRGWNLRNRKQDRCTCDYGKRDGRGHLGHIYDGYTASAARRGYKFEITYEDFLLFANSCCFYCGQEPMAHKTGRNGVCVYNGIDRFDNLQGYTKDNCVPCCTECNWRKGTAADGHSFLGWIRRVYLYQNSLLTNNNKRDTIR